MKKLFIICLSIVLLLSFTAVTSAEGTSGFRSTEDVISSIPSGYGIPASFDLFTVDKNTTIPLKKIAAVEILERSQPVNMLFPHIPSFAYCVLDADGNYLFTNDSLIVISKSEYIMPPSLEDGILYIPVSIGGVMTDAPVEYTFASMSTLDKLNYSYNRGWLSDKEYLNLVDIAFNTPSALPAQYVADEISDEYTLVLDVNGIGGTQEPLRAALDLSGYTSYLTNDGKFRIYSYDDATKKATTSSSFATAIRDLLNSTSYAIRTNVLSKLGKTSIPQENNSGVTTIIFNSALGDGGRTVDNGSGTFRIELGLNAGRYVLTHEFAHVVQMNGYGMSFASGRKWWMEGTADWIGKILASNDHYLKRLATIQSQPTLAYDYEESTFDKDSRGYGSTAFAMYIQAKVAGSVASSLSYCPSYTQARDAINKALSSDLASHFKEYAKRMYRPSTQMNGTVSYATDWPEASYQKTGTMADNTTKNMSTPSISHLGVDYIRIQTSTNSSRTINISLPNYNNGCAYYLLTRGTSTTAWTYQQVTSASVSVSNYNTTVKELVICVVNASGSTKTNISYAISVAP